jgi:ABC-2 type transport system ATP-binding protein
MTPENDPFTPVPAASPAIDVAHLVKVYKTARAVDDVSFRIARGSITGLLGGNGAGKTTTIAMIMGLALLTSGRVQVLGCAMPAQRAAVLGRMNFESPYVDMPMRLTVRQNLSILAGFTPWKICASASRCSPPPRGAPSPSRCEG